MSNVIIAQKIKVLAQLRLIKQASARGAIVLGAVVLFGWAIGSHSITSVIPGWVDMKVNTALGFMLSGLALLLVESHPAPIRATSGVRRIVAIGAPLIALTIGVLTELEYAFGLNLHIDKFFFRDFVPLDLSYYPGRISPITALNLVCVSLAILTLATKRAVFLSEILAGFVVFTTLVVLTGATYGLQSMLAGGHYTAVAVHTNLGFLLVCTAIFCANSNSRIMRLLTHPGAAGKVARRLLPAALFVPLTISWLSAWGERKGIFGMEFAVSLFTISTIVAFTVLVWFSANFLRRSEEETRDADDKLRDSRQRYNFLAETLPQILWTTKADGNVDYFNQRWIDYTGLSLDQTRDWGWKAVIHPDDIPNCIERWTKSLKTGNNYEIEYRLKRADGSYLWHLGRGYALRSEEGEIIEWVGTCTDIDEQKRTREVLETRVAERTVELATARERLEAVLDAATQVAIIATTTDGKITVFNFGAEQMLGYTAAEMLDRTPDVFHLSAEVEARGRELTKELGRPIHGCDVFFQKARLGQPEEREWTYVRKDGTQLTVNLIITASRNGRGEVDGFLGIATDITVRKLQQQELRAAKERAEQADRSKSDFLANMSHEIRTPMNGVIGMTGLLLDTQLDAEQRGLSETIRSSAESLLGLINDILDFSKIEAGKMHFEELDFNLRKVVEDSLEMMAGQAQTKGIELVGGIPTGMTTKLRGDPGRVHQILTNLIGNAIKFTRAGEVAVIVQPKVETATDVTVRFEIRDTGIGITPEAQAQLFQAFMQADASTSRKFGGTGLGLAICKKLAESMHGKIGVESVTGHGSTFWVELKFPRQLEAPMERQPAHEFVDNRVLIVDDNATSRHYLQQQVNAWRMRSGCAASGEEALAMLRKSASELAPYALAVIDLRMPDMDGLALARTINADPRLIATKLVLLTPLGKPIPAEELKSVDVAACCVKPVRQSALFDCIIQVLAAAAPSEGPMGRKTFVRSEPAVLHKERILVAEDNMVNQRVALGNLRKLGYTADVVANGLEVLDAIDIKKYDIILMDCHMPELDGYEVTKEIRRREKNGRHVWIIAMTANVMVGDREKCLAAGMDDYVSKPLRRGEMRAALEKCATTKPAPAAIDETTLKNLGDEDEWDLAELIELFVTSAPKSITDMKHAVETDDAKALTFAAHTLKGSCGNLGKFPLYEICAQLEQIGRSGNLRGVSDLVSSAENELRRLVEALSSYRKPKSSV